MEETICFYCKEPMKSDGECKAIICKSCIKRICFNVQLLDDPGEPVCLCSDCYKK
jgi:hypothetical protein